MTVEEYRKQLAAQKTAVKNPKKQMIGRNSRAMGNCFEDLIERSCQWYQEEGQAYIEKTPEPMKPLQPAEIPGQFIACYTKPAQPDYKGTCLGGKSICFEAKHTDADRILRNRVSDEQRDALERHYALGASTFILLSFGLSRFYRIPFSKWMYMKATYGRLYIQPGDIAEHEVPFTGAVIKFLK